MQFCHYNNVILSKENIDRTLIFLSPATVDEVLCLVACLMMFVSSASYAIDAVCLSVILSVCLQDYCKVMNRFH